MNNLIDKYSLAGDKFMSEIHLRQPATGVGTAKFTSSACKLFKKKQIIQIFQAVGD